MLVEETALQRAQAECAADAARREAAGAREERAEQEDLASPSACSSSSQAAHAPRPRPSRSAPARSPVGGWAARRRRRRRRRSCSRSAPTSATTTQATRICSRKASSRSRRVLSFAKTPSGGQVVDRSALIMPQSGRSGRRSPCLHGVDPGDNSMASRQISFPIRSPASRWPLGGTGDTARAAEGHSQQPGRCQPGSRAGAGPPHLGRGPAPSFDPSVSPSTVRTIRGDFRPGRSRSKTSPAGVGGRGDRGSRRSPHSGERSRINHCLARSRCAGRSGPEVPPPECTSWPA
jgi:hypothetical protein